MATFQIFVKPAGGLCNLNCSYCYFHSGKEDTKEISRMMMSGQVLELYISQHIEASADEEIFFSWHGGEPTLAGLDFFKRAVELQQKHCPPDKTIRNGIQTNGTLLNRDWCRFLSAENFYVGLSLDGPAELHNHHRVDRKGRGSAKEALNAYKMLQDEGAQPEILCVVSAGNVNYPLEVYRFFKQLGASYLTFLPLVNRSPGNPKAATPDSVPARAFGQFMVAIFDEWLENDIGKVSIQLFEEAISTAFHTAHSLCVFKVNCGGVPMLGPKGDFYSCDHFADNAHYIGNIADNKVSYYLNCPEQQAFGKRKSETLPQYCRRCEVLEMCNGECPKNRFITAPDGEPGLNYLCEGYRMFFKHCQPFIDTVKRLNESQKNFPTK